MKLNSYAHSSVPIFWYFDTGAQPPDEAHTCLPPIVGFAVVYTGCDLAAFSTDLGEVDPCDLVFAYGISDIWITEDNQDDPVVGFGVFEDC